MTTIVRTFEEAGLLLTLRDLGTHVELLLGQVPILSSRALGTERAFGELVSTLLPPGHKRVLVGGLGFAATLLGVLSAAPADAEVLVVERLQTVIDLASGDLRHLTGGALADPRVRLVRDDVAAVLRREHGIGAVLLDVDNGPNWASFRTNAAIYSAPGLYCLREALCPEGAVAVWSGYPADGFVATLRKAKFFPSVVPLRENGLVRARAYVGRRAADQATP